MTTIQQSLNTWADSTHASDPNLSSCIQNAIAALTHYTTSKAPFQWEALNTGLELANGILPYCAQHQLLQTAILLPITKSLTREELNSHINDPDVLSLLTTLRKMDIVDATYANKQAIGANKQAKLRSMLLALVGDIRAVIIKLAEQYHAVRHLPKTRDDKHDHIAMLAQDIYAPLANRLGLYHLKWPLEDLAFRYLHGDRYKSIAKGLKEKRVEREAFIQSFITRLNELLSKELPEISTNIKGRAKHIFSIHKKSERKGMEPHELYDMAAVRILLDDKEACYHVLACIHNCWDHVPEEYDDYVTKPKPNGYQSIHTVVVTEDERLVEIQIRSHAMDQAAELGVAAHWKYKESGSKSANTAQEINWLNELLHWQREVTENTHRPNLFQDTFGNRVYVFTPENQVIDLAVGATPIDFAYAIHTSVGHRCQGAKINGRIVPLTHTLKTGDLVTILTQKEGQPRRDWLNPELGYVRTRSAIHKIKNWFKKQNHDKHCIDGRAIWDKHLKKSEVKQADINKLVNHFNFTRFENLIAALGSGDLHIRTVIRQLRYIKGVSTPTIDHHKALNNKTKQPQKEEKAAITVDGIGSLMTQLARCCHPIPGDPIIGYLTTNHGITIHHQSCRNIKHLDPKKKEREMNAVWGNTKDHRYSAHLRIACDQENAVSTALWSTLTHQKIAYSTINSQLNRNGTKRLHHVAIHVTDQQALNNLINSLSQIKGVHQIARLGLTDPLNTKEHT